MTDHFATLVRFAAMDEAALAKPWIWREGEHLRDVRYALYFTVEDEQAAVVKAQARPSSVAARILALSQAAFGDLRGLLAAVPAELLDRSPADGEWSVRRTLQHALDVERSYRAAVAWAVERTDADPVRMPDERKPVTTPEEVAGSVGAIVALFGRERAETDRAFGGFDERALARPSVWATHPVDVAFRLHRNAAHLTEHTVQCDTTLARLGLELGDAARITRNIARLRGLHERASDAATLAALDATAAARAAAG